MRFLKSWWRTPALSGLLFFCLAVAVSENASRPWWYSDSDPDPLPTARAVADRELFGRVISDGEARPEIELHHNLEWLDSTLMSGVAALYDRAEERGEPAARYLEYVKAWGAQWPGGYPIKVFHGDRVCAGHTFLWLYEKSGRRSDHLSETDGMIDFVFLGRKFTQYQYGYTDYWMRFWNDDLHMVPPFLARRGRIVGSKGIPGGKDGRDIAMHYCRAYSEVLEDPATGLYWHDPRAIGDYQWGRGNGWVAAGYTKIYKELAGDPEYAQDRDWLAGKLRRMAATLKKNRNVVGTWNADILDRETYVMPETSGSGFFVYMMAAMINRGELSREYVPVVQKAWHFLRLSVTREGSLLRVQPVGRGPVKRDFETNSESYGVGGFLLAAAEVSGMDREVWEQAAEAECIKLGADELELEDGHAMVPLSFLRAKAEDFPEDARGKVQAVVAGARLPETLVEGDKVVIKGLPASETDSVYIFYRLFD
ncbi:MAG: glycoside hydrolase family 88 protein [bacterium]